MMAAQILDGKKVAAAVRARIKEEIQALKQRSFTPGLAVVLVGDDPASRVYVRSKDRACQAVGLHSFMHRLPGDAEQAQLLELIESLNANPAVHGILVQLPLPAQIDADVVIQAIDPAKDVDGFHPFNVGKLTAGLSTFVPCTPRGIMHLLAEYNIPLKGKEAVIIGRSNIVGKPIAHLLLAQHATVTICHSRTVALEEVARRADVLVAAVGRPQMVTGDMIKPGAVVVDVGINRLPEGLVGDVDFEAAKEVAGYITPVPGGVGPLTIAMLLQNTLDAAMK
jgi:methylenetetrahydrofolate dehydrogenase (NADP+)/methenyltetrahydrofolate cyclohydrolase